MGAIFDADTLIQYAASRVRNHQLHEFSCIQLLQQAQYVFKTVALVAITTTCRWENMNKNVTAIILLVLAVVAVWYGWTKLKPYMSTGGDTSTEMPADGAVPATQP